MTRLIPGFGSLAMSALGAAVSGSPLEWVLQVGALGLCGWMVYQNYRQAERTSHVLARKDETIEGQFKRIDDILANTTHTSNQLVQAMNERPCLHGDHRVKPNQEPR